MVSNHIMMKFLTNLLNLKQVFIDRGIDKFYYDQTLAHTLDSVILQYIETVNSLQIKNQKSYLQKKKVLSKLEKSVGTYKQVREIENEIILITNKIAGEDIESLDFSHNYQCSKSPSLDSVYHSSESYSDKRGFTLNSPNNIK